jgi:hypothetical protein
MKRKCIFLLLPLFLLTSCHGVDSAKVLSEAKTAVSGLGEVTETSYSLTVQGNVSQFSTFEEPENPYSVPNGKVGSTGKSYLLYSPIRINADNFYPDQAFIDSGAAPANYTYYKLEDYLLSSSDPVTKMEFRKEGDNLLFYSEGVSKTLLFHHIVVDTDTQEVSDVVKVYSRYDITLTYNSHGLLIKEEIHNHKPLTSTDKLKTVDVVEEYTYAE